MKSNMIYPPLTKLQCCPTSDGGAAAIVCSQRFLDARPQLHNQAVKIAGMALATDAPSLFSRSSIDLIGYDMTKRATKAAFAEAGIGPEQVSCYLVHLALPRFHLHLLSVWYGVNLADNVLCRSSFSSFTIASLSMSS